MKIITISRQFGSGGRELGKRLSDILGFDYYDREIITKLSEEHGLDSEYVRRVLSNHEWNTVPLTFSHSFSGAELIPNINIQLLSKQREIIKDIAAAGNDCIIVGRNADVILREYKPFRVFVCADIESRVQRCMRYENKKPESDRLSEKEIRKNIRRIDRDRNRLREAISGKDRSDSSAFDLVVNAGEWDIKKLASAVADFSEKFFGGSVEN